jgi:hypothetical protein
VYVQRAESGTRLVIAVGSKRRTEVTGAVMRLAERALVARRFEAQECLAWGEEGKTLAWSEVEPILTRLLDEGLLERVAK